MKTETKPKPKRPTPRQERFARLVASGEVTQEEAYIECYPTAAKWKPAIVRSKASHLANNGNIRATIEEIRAAANRVSRMKLERARRIREALGIPEEAEG